MKKIPCNFCGSNNCKFLFHGQDRSFKNDDGQLFDVVKCENCGLAYLNPQPTKEELKKYYTEDYDQYGGGAIFKYGPLSRPIKFFLDRFKKRRPVLKNDQPNLAESAINYLDFGCGGGINLEEQRKKHPTWHLYGLDIIDIACLKTRQRGFEVFCGDINELEMPENFFDAVNMSHVIEHLNDPKAALLKINRMLKKGGKLTIALPNFDSLAAKLFKKYWYGLDAPRHLYFFTPKTVALLLKQTGFSAKKISYAPGPLVEILSLYYWLGKKDRRISPIIWRMFLPLGFILFKLKKTSIMTIDAVK